eukprot:210506-Alexandrium_andersonii.AAC.1
MEKVEASRGSSAAQRQATWTAGSSREPVAKVEHVWVVDGGQWRGKRDEDEDGFRPRFENMSGRGNEEGR